MRTAPFAPRSGRNRATLAAEAQLAAAAPRLVRILIARAEGGDPAAMRLCLERALPAGRAPPIDLGPVHDRASLKRAVAAVAAALAAGDINIRQATRFIDAFGAAVRARRAVGELRALAAIEADLAKSMAAMGLDRVFTVAPATLAKLADNDDGQTK